MKRILSFIFLFSIILSACEGAIPTSQATATPTATAENLGSLIYPDPSPPTEARIEDLLKRMTLEEKIGQMTQVEKNSIKPGDITKYYIGSVLSGGGGSPAENTPQAWYAMVEGFQKE